MAGRLVSGEGLPGRPSMESHEGLHPDTLAVGFGYDPAEAYGAVKPPIVLSSTFAYTSAQAAKDVHRAYFDGPAPERDAPFIYARLDHPNLKLLQSRLAVLDSAEDAAAFASGMAAISATMLAHLKPGDSVLHTTPLYGGTHGLLYGPLAGLGIKAVGIADALSQESVVEAAETALKHGPIGLIHIESPANPTAGIADIRMIADFAVALVRRQDKRPVISVDNTFLGPVYQHPLSLGADMAVYSLTKYVGGHSDLVAGAVVGSKSVVQPIRSLRSALGTQTDPNTAWMLLRSLETLSLRMSRANENAAAVAEFLRNHPKIQKVNYLGFLQEGDPAYPVFQRQCQAPGSTFSFYIRGGEAEAFRMLDRLRVIKLAVSLGGTETLISHPASTTHSGVPHETRQRQGVTDAMIRISVGIENPQDLIVDLTQALESV